MSEMITIPKDELAHLEERAGKLARDKSSLQLLVYLMNRINVSTGLDQTIEALLTNILGVIGGENLVLIYKIDNELFSADVYGKKMMLDRIDDRFVQQVFESHEPVELEQEFSIAKVQVSEGTKSYTWIFPLCAGNELIGVIRMEGLQSGVRDLYTLLPPFFKYAGIVLKSEIMGHSRLRKAYDDLQEREYWLRESQRIARLGSYVLDVRSGRWTCSEMLNELLGIDKDYSKTIDGWTRLIHPDHRGRMQQYFASLLTSGQNFDMDYKIIREGDGQERWMYARGTFDLDRDGFPVRMLGTVQDITERKTAEAIRMRMSRLESIGILAGGIAHDFNNLLSIIVSNVFLAKMRLNREDAAFQDLEDAEVALQQASELSSRFLTFSKGGEPFRRPTNIEKIIRDSSQFLASHPLIIFRCDIPDNIRQVSADERQIELAMRNLLVNALESMPNGGFITVCAKNLDVGADNDLNLEERSYVEISVADEGKGIPEENLTRIFDPYFTTKDLWSQKGMGMGLAICHSLISKHGGNISAESGTGKGTIMRLYLPAVVP